jgi:uncharacterized protein (TIGR03437 family)
MSRLVTLITALLFCTVQADADLLHFEGLTSLEQVTTQFPGITFSNTITLTAGISLNEVDFPPQMPAGTSFAERSRHTIAASNSAHAGRGQNEQKFSSTLELSVAAVTIPRSPSGKTPVILLNGFQPKCALVNNASTQEASKGTFGNLAKYLGDDEVPVAFFNNCTYGDSVSIEQLAEYLRLFIAGLTFDDGTPIDQVDLVAHSMGGLIARAYLAGMRFTRIPSHLSDGSFLPPMNHKVRKLILIATPNFGSFQAPLLVDQLPSKAAQLTELTPGSWFLWNLATWNQRDDDLRGVDALAVIGDAGTFYGGGRDDGVVSMTSASLGFSRLDERTRIVNYCHTDRFYGLLGLVAPLGMDCKDHSLIANIDSEAHDTARIVRSFLKDDPSWKSIGKAPSQNPALSQFGGVYFGQQSAMGDWVSDLSGVSFGNIPLNEGGGRKTIFFQEPIPGRTDTFSVTSASYGSLSCGPSTQPVGFYKVILCKSSSLIVSVGPLSPTASGRVVRSGAMITISGTGFGQQRCALCGVLVDPYDYGPPNSEVFPVGDVTRAWSDQTITAFLPAYSGLVSIYVAGPNGGSDSINILAVPPAPSISLSKTQLQFSFILGGVLPVAQAVTVSNAGSGNLVWSAMPSASWISVSSSSTAVTLSANPSGLSPGTYTGTVSVTASGATNSPQQISVTLTVTDSAAPTIASGGVVNAADYTPTVAPGMLIAVFGDSMASKVSSAAGTPLPTALDGTSVEVNGQAIPLFFVSPKQINAQMPFGISGQVQVRVRTAVALSTPATVTVAASAPRLFTKTMDGKGEPILVHNADWSPVSATSPARPGEYLILFLTGLGAVSPAIPAGQAGGDNGKNGPLNQLPVGAVTVAFGGRQVAISFAGLAPGFVGLYQVNFQVPADMPRGTFALVVSTKDGSSQAGVLATAEGVAVVPLLDRIVLSRSSVTGGETVTGEVFLSSPALWDISVGMTTSDSSLAVVPSGLIVFINKGQQSGTFSVRTSAVSEVKTVRIIAETQDSPSIWTSLTITPGSVFSNRKLVVMSGTINLDGQTVDVEVKLYGPSTIPLIPGASVADTGSISNVSLRVYFAYVPLQGNTISYTRLGGYTSSYQVGSQGYSISSGALDLTANSPAIGAVVSGNLRITAGNRTWETPFAGRIVSIE